jgi:plasmid stabilization system protein ParE
VALRYVIKACAQREIERAAQWWAENRLDAPGAVRADVEGALFVLVRHPGLGQKVETGRTIQIRRYLMRKTYFPQVAEGICAQFPGDREGQGLCGAAAV